MRIVLALLTYIAAFLSFLALVRPRDTARALLFWVPKLLGGALAPILAITSALGALQGLLRRDPKLITAGTLGAALAARLLKDVAQAQGDFDTAFGPDGQSGDPEPKRPRRISLLARNPRPTVVHTNVVFGESPTTGKALFADFWQPAFGIPYSGLGLIYIHGGGWRIGDKDELTRPFFRRLAGQGHVILDVAYTLWPQASVSDMVSEIKQAVLWMKERGVAAYGVDPERIVLMGGSAGGHLALLSAYTANHPEFPPPVPGADTSVRGIVAFYPPTDFVALHGELEGIRRVSGRSEQVAESVLDRVFGLHARELGFELRSRDLLPAILGGEPDDVPETYRLLSPISHVGPHCPPTLLLQGSDDVFRLAPSVRSLHARLRDAGVPSVLVEFPHTEHAFDLVLPRLSPAAQAATYDIERFLALLA
jgi:acetyl esterase/lipase